MSCWRECNCELKNVKEDILKKALARMNMGIDSRKRVGTSYGTFESNSAAVDGAFTLNGKELPLGYVLADAEGKFGIRGDFWNTGLDSETFLGQLGQYYTEENIKQNALDQFFVVDSATVNADGDTEIVLCKTVA